MGQFRFDFSKIKIEHWPKVDSFLRGQVSGVVPEMEFDHSVLRKVRSSHLGSLDLLNIPFPRNNRSGFGDILVELSNDHRNVSLNVGINLGDGVKTWIKFGLLLKTTVKVVFGNFWEQENLEAKVLLRVVVPQTEMDSKDSLAPGQRLEGECPCATGERSKRLGHRVGLLKTPGVGEGVQPLSSDVRARDIEFNQADVFSSPAGGHWNQFSQSIVI